MRGEQCDCGSREPSRVQSSCLAQTVNKGENNNVIMKRRGAGILWDMRAFELQIYYYGVEDNFQSNRNLFQNKRTFSQFHNSSQRFYYRRKIVEKR